MCTQLKVRLLIPKESRYVNPAIHRDYFRRSGSLYSLVLFQVSPRESYSGKIANEGVLVRRFLFSV